MNTSVSRFALLGLAFSAITLIPPVFAQDSAPGSSSSSQSQASQHGAPDPQKQAARLTKKLGLSADQSTKLTAILQSRQQQMAAARGDSSLSPQDRRTKLHAIQQDSDTQINALLTPAQQTQYATMKQNMKNHWQSAHGAPGSASSSSDNNSDSNSH